MNQAGFFDHLEELAGCLRTWLLSLVVSTLVFLVVPGGPGAYKPLVLELLSSIQLYLLPPSVHLISGDFVAPMMLYFTAAAILGFIATSPVLGYEVYRFVSPGLLEEEKRSARPFTLAFTLSFLGGCLFGLFIVFPMVMWGAQSFIVWTGAEPLIKITDFYNLLFLTTIASGVSFTFPVAFILLVKYHVLSTRIVAGKNRVYLWLGTYLITGLITPDGNPISDILLFLPVIGMIELAVRIAGRYED